MSDPGAEAGGHGDRRSVRVRVGPGLQRAATAAARGIRVLVGLGCQSESVLSRTQARRRTRVGATDSTRMPRPPLRHYASDSDSSST